MSSAVLECGVATRPLPSTPDAPCGDLGYVRRGEDLLVALFDGLGHGPRAHAAAVTARDHLASLPADEPLDRAMTSLHRALRGSRGVVASLCRIATADARLTFCGIGNITTRLLDSERVQELVPQQGIVGQAAPTARVRVVALPQEGLLVLHTDGISSRVRGSCLRALTEGPAQAAAERLLVTLGRDRDDAGCLVVRVRR